jgi:hypothetical protein
VEWFIIGWFTCGTVGALIGSARGHTAGGALLGLLLGPIGWLIAAMADSRVRCPACREIIQKEARLCSHCRTPLQWSDGVPVLARAAGARDSRGIEAWPNNDPLA